ALNSYGITSSQTDDYCVFREIPFETVNEAYKELEASGELTVRVYEQSNFTTLEELSRFVEAGNVTGSGTDFFRIGPLKMLGDGSLGARTAHLSRPYADDPSVSGFSLFTTEHMNAMVSYANAHGMQIAIHAIGDACLDQVLNAVDLALQEHPREDHRHGVVHCQISRADQLKRIEDLHMHVYAQSIFLDYDNHIVEKRVGKELASTSYFWKTLMKNGVCVSNGSDCPVELPDALEGIECAVTRTSLDGTGPYLPEEAFTVKEAIDSFTVNAARGSFEEDRKGKIKTGYQADFTVLGEDPFTVDPRTIHAIPVRETWLAGRKVYQAK
ncbi:MAG: amidohydrolase family protein, partial [Erysipelotrichaceae bacterium]|nr:amidohydrolase family protein [Erysipelotrichaceae bacterium]